MKKFHCNILEADFLSVEPVEHGLKKDNHHNFVDLQMYDDMGNVQIGVTLSLESTKELVKHLQSYINDNKEWEL